MNICTALCLSDKAFIHHFSVQKIRVDLNMHIMKFKMHEILTFEESF
jgi:hypothetical protein